MKRLSENDRSNLKAGHYYSRLTRTTLSDLSGLLFKSSRIALLSFLATDLLIQLLHVTLPIIVVFAPFINFTSTFREDPVRPSRLPVSISKSTASPTTAGRLSLTMESLTLNDGTPYQRHYHYRDQKPRSPRLPTPDVSRSSRETLVGPYDNGPFFLRPSSGERSLGIPNGPTHYRRDSRNTVIPHSPPYLNGEGQKPSLPPLKTVLGNSISSPPRTPSPGGSPGQLAPREPSYITSTFKPPSLYPNKKQRMEPLYSGVAATGPRFAPSTTLEPTTSASSMRSSVQFPPMDSTHVRRSHAQSVGSPPWSSQGASARSSDARTHENAAGPYQNADQPPVEPSLPRRNPFTGTAPDPFARQMRDSFGQSGDRPSSRRSSVSTYAMYPPTSSFDREPSRPGPYSAGGHAMRDGYTDSRDTIRYGRPEEHQACQLGFPAQPYQSNVPAYFMPSHYEYQHGKARKRSNLPKQSTEIMKTWFDQNIANPYPSEEQKAVFSNATGISMTQVSNWFINHRRRCPELRDKREKSRGGGRDSDM